MTEVVVPVSLGGSGQAYRDDASARGMAGQSGYGYASLLFPLLSEIVAAAQTVVTIAEPVSDAAASITLVAADLENIDLLVGDLANVDAVAGDLANVNLVAADLAALNSVAADLANINLLAADLANVDAVAADLVNIDLVAPHVENVDIVAAGIDSVNTAAANIASIQSASTNAQVATDQATAAQSFALTATAQAALAVTAAASASSVLAQDLSGTSGLAAALHRSPNAVVATLLGDCRNDSDGGAWRKKTAWTSWYQEALNGTYLPSPTGFGWQSEMDARDYFGSLGAASAVTGDSSNFAASLGGWAARNTNATVTYVNGRMRLTQQIFGSPGSADLTMTGLTIGQRYQIALTATTMLVSKNTFLDVRTAAAGGGSSVLAGGVNVNLSTFLGTKFVSFVATQATHYVSIASSTVWAVNDFIEYSGFTVKPVDLSKNPSGVFYQLATDGKFYRLWKNLLQNSGFTGGTSGGYGAGLVFPTNWSAYTAGAGSPTITFTPATRSGYSGNNLRFVSTGQQMSMVQSFSVTGGMPVVWSFYVEALASGSAPLSQIFSTANAGAMTWTKNGNAATGATTVAAGDFIQVTATIPATATVSVIYGAGISGPITADITLSPLLMEYGTVASAYEDKAAGVGSQTEVFRGNVAEFPEQPIRVLEAGRLVIYAGEQPGRPMWRVFTAATNNWIYGTSITGAEIVNGKLWVATNNGLCMIDFAKDAGYVWTTNGRFRMRGTIATSNTAPGLDKEDGAAALPSSVINAVAVATMPDAPVDPVTGLQVPTIACYTAGGVSIIHHDGTVRNSASTSAFVSGSITPKGVLASTTAGAVYWAADPSKLGASFALTQISTSLPGFAFASPANGVTQPKRDLILKRATTGAKLSWLRLNEATPSASIQGDVTDTYNTGAMMAGTVRCLLADTVAGVVSNPSTVADRSYKNSPATVFGTLTRTAVAFAAQLVFWGSFSATNYVQEGYSADLDPVTGGFTVSVWGTIPTGVAAAGWAFDRSAATGAYYQLGHDATGKIVATVSDGTTTRTATTTTAYNTGQPIKVRLQYETSGTLTIKVNGEQAAQATGAPLLTLTNASAVATIGNNRALSAPWAGSLALVKVGMTVPTDDASRWMYAQELPMFQPGAQVTLPDSGAVVDMDYDPQENSLKVVSAAYESKFVGCVRVSSSPVSAGSFTKVSHRGGLKLTARSGTNPGVDITVPPLNLREELYRRAEEAKAAARDVRTFDWTGGFTANTANGATQINSMSVSLVPPSTVYPSNTTVIGAQVTGAGIPVGAVLATIQGSTIANFDKAATATASAVPIAFTDFILPAGWEVADDVFAARLLQQEGSTKDYTRLFDGFRERVRFGTAPGATAWVRINARRAMQ